MDFKLPDIGEGVHEGEITRWLVKAGDTITADQPMVEVMTDKATVEIPSPVTGVVDQIVVKEGETVEVGKVIIRLAEKGQPSKPAPKVEPELDLGPELKREFRLEPEPPKAKKPKEIPAQAAPEAEILPFHVLATPATRKLARDLKINLAEVKGTGPHNRVTKEDVTLYYESHQAAAPRPSHPVAAVAKKPMSVSVPSGAVERIPLKGIRKRISEAMAHSKRTAAHFTYVEEVDMSAVVKLREEAKVEAQKRNLKLTYLPFIMKALIPALKEFPYLNSSLDDEAGEILLKGDYNIGIATDTEQGLIVPVVKHAERKNIWELATEISVLAEKARSGKLALDDLREGTFTITNAGNIGGVFATPVINYPEVAILGVNAIRKRPVVAQDQIVIRDMMYLSLSVDHRVVDGADAARFMNRLIYFLSDPIHFVFA